MFKIKKENKNDNINSLSNLKDNKYVEYLESNISNNNIRNIAIIGPYGSGKTSIVRTFLSNKNFIFKNKIKKSIFLSRDSFSRIAETKKEEIKYSLYLELLKHNSKYQSYRALYNALLFKEIENERLNKKERIVLFLSTIIFIISSFILTSYLVFYKTKNNFIASIVGGIVGVTLIIISIILKFLFNKKIKFTFDKLSVDLSKQDKTTYKNEIQEIKENPVYYENAIINLIKKEKIRFIIIEDLERDFNNESFLEIINELKKISDMINATIGLQNKVKFIFCINDDSFIDAEERLKNFDFIIPIGPVSTNGTSFDVIYDKVKSYNVTTLTISIISPYFFNMRLINSLCVEFFLMNSTTDGTDANQLFCLASLHTLYPKFYSTLYFKNNHLDELFLAINKINNNNIFFKNDFIIIIDKIINNGYVKKESKDDFVDFMKAILINRLINLNYKKYISSNSINALSLNDINTIKKYNNYENINDFSIEDPCKFLDYVKQNPNQRLFSDINAVNPYIIKFLISGKYNYKNEIDLLKNTLQSNQELSRNIFYKLVNICSENLNELQLIFDYFDSDESLYFSFELLRNELREKTVYYFVNSLSNEKTYQKDFKVEHVIQIFNYAIGNMSYNDINENSLLYFELKIKFDDISFLSIDKFPKLFNKLKENENYKLSCNNVLILHPMILYKPLFYLKSNIKLFQFICKDIDVINDILKKAKEIDSIDEVESFFANSSVNSMLISQPIILHNIYFDNFKFKINFKVFKDINMLILCINRLLIKLDDDFYDFFKLNSNRLLDSFRKALANNSMTFSKKRIVLRKDVVDSFFINDSDLIDKINKLINWMEYDKYSSNIKPKTYPQIFKYLPEKNKISMINSIINTKNYQLFDNIISIDEAYNIFLNENIKLNYDWCKGYLNSNFINKRTLNLLDKNIINESPLLKQSYDAKCEQLFKK